MASSIPPHNITKILRTDVGTSPQEIQQSKAQATWKTVASKIGEIAKDNFKDIGKALNQPYDFKISQASNQEFMVEIFKQGETTPVCTIQTTQSADPQDQAFKQKVEAIWKALFNPTFSISGETTSGMGRSDIYQTPHLQTQAASSSTPTRSAQGISGFQGTSVPTGPHATQRQGTVDFGEIKEDLASKYNTIFAARQYLSASDIPQNLHVDASGNTTPLGDLEHQGFLDATCYLSDVDRQPYYLPLFEEGIGNAIYNIQSYDQTNPLRLYYTNRHLDFYLLEDIKYQLSPKSDSDSNPKNLRAALVSVDLLQEPIRTQFINILGIRDTPYFYGDTEIQNTAIDTILTQYPNPSAQLAPIINMQMDSLRRELALETTKMLQEETISNLEAREAAIFEEIQCLQAYPFTPVKLDESLFSSDDPAHTAIEALANHLRSLNDLIRSLEATAYSAPSTPHSIPPADETTISNLQKELDIANAKLAQAEALEKIQRKHLEQLKASSATELSTLASASQPIATELAALQAEKSQLETNLSKASEEAAAAKIEVTTITDALQKEIASQATKSQIALEALSGVLSTSSDSIPKNLEPVFQALANYFSARLNLQQTQTAKGSSSTLEKQFDTARTHLETCRSVLAAESTEDPQVKSLIAYALATQGSDQMSVAQEARIRALTIQLQETKKELVQARSQNHEVRTALASTQASKAELEAQNQALQAQVQELTTDKKKLEQALQKIATSVGFTETVINLDGLKRHIAEKLVGAELKAATAAAAAEEASGQIQALAATLAEEQARVTSLLAAEKERSLAIKSSKDIALRYHFEDLDIDSLGLPTDLTDIEDLLGLGSARCRLLSDQLRAAQKQEALAKADAARAQEQLHALQEAQEKTIAAGIATAYERINASLLPLYRTLTGTDLEAINPANLESQLTKFNKDILEAKRRSIAVANQTFDTALKAAITGMLKKMGLSIVPPSLGSDSSKPINLEQLFTHLGHIITTYLTTGAEENIASLKAQVAHLTASNESLKKNLSTLSSAIDVTNKEMMQAKKAALEASRKAEELEAVVRDASKSAQAATIAKDEALRRAEAAETALFAAKADTTTATQKLGEGVTKIAELTTQLLQAKNAAKTTRDLLARKEQELSAIQEYAATLKAEAATGKKAIEAYTDLQARNRALFIELETLKADAARRAGRATASASVVKDADEVALNHLRTFVANAAQFIAQLPNDDYLPDHGGKDSGSYEALIKLANKKDSSRSNPVYSMSVTELLPHVSFIEKVLEKMASTKPLLIEAARSSTGSGGFLSGLSAFLGSTHTPVTPEAASARPHVKVVPCRTPTKDSVSSIPRSGIPGTALSSSGSAASSLTPTIPRVPLPPRGHSTVSSLLSAHPESAAGAPTSATPPTSSIVASARKTILAATEAERLSIIGGAGTGALMGEEGSTRNIFSPQHTREDIRAHLDPTTGLGIDFRADDSSTAPKPGEPNPHKTPE